LISAGTPIMQVIPFKREDWTSELTEVSEEEMSIRNEGLFKKITGSYKKGFRSNKNYR
jgi:hypothetical protein